MNETQSAVLPWPAAWPVPKRTGGPRWVLWYSAVAVATLGVSLILPVPGHSRAAVLVALIVPALGLGLGHTAVHSNVRARSVRRVHTTETGELSVPFLPDLWTGLWVLVVGCLLILLLLVYASWQVGFDNPPDPAATVIGAVLLVLAVPPAALVVEGLRGTVSRGELLLSPDRIRYRTFSYDVDVDWAAVQRVSVAGGDGLQIVLLTDGPRLHAHSWLLRPSRTARAQAVEGRLVLRGLWLSVDPALALHTLRYYHAHPDARVELGTGAAVYRVRCAGVVSA